MQLVGLALAEACDANNDEVMGLLLSIWKGKCSALQAQPLLRAFSARGDGATVARLLARGPAAMVQMDGGQRSHLASIGLAHAAGEKNQRAKVLSTLLQAGAEPRSEHGEIALRNAARDGQVESMRLLLHEGTDVNAVDDDGRTVLCVAACSGCCEGVRCLLEHGAQVRMRCHDGREPLDFAVDEAVRQLLLAEVEKLRMGLLDELLADEEADGGKGGKGKKGKKAKKGGEPESSKKGPKEGKQGALENAAAAAPEAVCAETAEPLSQSKSSKKKQKKAASKSAARGDDASVADQAEGANGRIAVQPEDADAATTNKPPKKKAAKGLAQSQLPRTGMREEPLPSSLEEAAVQLLRAQPQGPSMRVSALVSALYERSAAFKEEIKGAGGAKLWLSEHADKFVVDTDCSPGQEAVALCPFPVPCLDDRVDAAGENASGNPSDESLSCKILSAPNGRVPNGDVEGHGSSRKSEDRIMAHSDRCGEEAQIPTRPAPRVGSTHSLALSEEADYADGGYSSFPFSWSVSERASMDAADDAAAAALLGASLDESSNDPVLIEKKIRAVQKKLRRVHSIEELAGQGSSLDNGQQVGRPHQNDERA